MHEFFLARWSCARIFFLCVCTCRIFFFKITHPPPPPPQKSNGRPLNREKIPLKKAIQLIKTSTLSQSNLSSIRFAFQLIDLDAYNSSVNNCQSLPTLLSVPQYTDFISIYSLIPFLGRTNHQTTNQKTTNQTTSIKLTPNCSKNHISHSYYLTPIKPSFQHCQICLLFTLHFQSQKPQSV